MVTIGTKIQASRRPNVGYRVDGFTFDWHPPTVRLRQATARLTQWTAPRRASGVAMSNLLETALPPRVTKTTLYRVAGWLLRVYIASLVVVGGYSLLWVLEVAGMLPGRVLSTVWIGIAATGALFLVLLVPLYYTARAAER